MRLLAVGLGALVLAAPASALEKSDFRYERPLAARGTEAIRVVPDRALYGHARPGLADLRIVDSAGKQVPWREYPTPRAPRRVSVPVLNSGRSRGAAVALLDTRGRGVLTELDLDLPQSGFVARVEVSGTDDRRTYTRLSSSLVYDLQGDAGPARSTVVTFPPSTFRYLQVRARGISRIGGATVSGPGPVPRPLAATPRPQVTTSGRATQVRLDLGYRHVPVDELAFSAATRRYNRPVAVEGSNDGKLWVPLASARVYRFGDSTTTRIGIEGRHRYLRLTIENGDDEPLSGIDVDALAFPRPLLVEGGHPRPLTVLYGNPGTRAPSYDFARLPVPGREEVTSGTLGAEIRNPAFEPPPDTRSFAARHPAAVTAALALAALVVSAGGFLALRRRA